MRRRLAPVLAGIAWTGFFASACASSRTDDRPPAAPIPYSQLKARESPDPADARPLSSLPGWDEEDHLAALRAFQAGCSAARDPYWRSACTHARSLDPSSDAAARAFFEANFLAEAPAPTGMLTAYFSPEYPAQDVPDEIFSAPVRRAPDLNDGPLTRAQIETTPARTALAFMKPEDLFFLQIQGSGTLVFPDGRRLRAIYAGDNGFPFTPIARPMLQAGLLPPDKLSGDNIRAWLAEHRGPEADAVMDRNPRYIYFELVPDDGREPAGAAGTPLTAGRSIAVDPNFHRYGALYWIDADAPTLAGAATRYRRLALALDTGAAIRGERRADLYLGRGEAAGKEAGRVRHVLNLVRLIPNPAPSQTIAAPGPSTSSPPIPVDPAPPPPGPALAAPAPPAKTPPATATPANETLPPA
jgi:membrane-bound lytic murein transglycosylase A